MRLLLIPLMSLMLLCGSVGCNGVVASDSLTIVMQANAATAKAVLDDTELTVPEAKTYIAKGASTLGDYYTQATIDPFRYSFTAGKPLLLSAQYYSIIRRGSMLGRTAVERIPKMSDDNAKRMALALAKIIYKIELSRQGEDE